MAQGLILEELHKSCESCGKVQEGYAKLARCVKVLKSKHTNKPENKPILSRQPVVKIEAKPNVSRNLC